MDKTTRLIQNHLGYTDDEMQIFQDNPRNMDVLSKAPELMGMRFKRTGCFDTGVRCGGWGHIVMEIKVEDR